MLGDHTPTKVVGAQFRESQLVLFGYKLRITNKGAVKHAREVRSRFVLARLWCGCGVHWISGRNA
jgi:hypothetical protein